MADPPPPLPLPRGPAPFLPPAAPAPFPFPAAPVYWMEKECIVGLYQNSRLCWYNDYDHI